MNLACFIESRTDFKKQINEITFKGEVMTTGEFADIVQKMREAQKQYFKTHSSEWLDKSKVLEKQVDTILEERNKREYERKNPGLFDEEGN